MGVVIVQSRPVAQVYRLFGALVALLIIMALAFGMASWRGSSVGGSPYGSLASVAPAKVPVIAAPARVAAEAPAVPVSAPAAAVADQPDAGTPADPVRTARMIPFEKQGVGATGPIPAPAAAVAAAQAAQAVPAVPAAPPAAVATAALPAAASPGAVPASDGAGGLININTASADALNHIPGAGRIGKTIVSHRPYGSVEDLVAHRILKASDFARIRARITTN